MASEIDYKRAAIEQWTADPCGENAAVGQLGTREYFVSLERASHEHAPWMHEELDYAGAAGLDVLDVGCGQGIDLVRYARAGARVTGIDLTPRHVELARQHLAAMELEALVVQGDAEHLPFPDASFDRVSSNGVLHHTPDMAAALREIRRVLRPGGEARILVYNKASLHYWVNQVGLLGILQRRLFAERSMAGVLSSSVEFSSIDARPLVQVYSPRRVRRMMADAGLKDVRTVVRQFEADDAFAYAWLASRVAALRSPRMLDRVGRVAGWYVMGTGRAGSYTAGWAGG